ncbi:myeloid cell surface antigen CD33-like isoform X4 [Dipodomys spectabilis]|uniref:myeloid cell surface antigen CD33-like isoform X4 n=1 Tax=Dipodomys spectabilis TaxID=105255 RepID=UPI001C53E095|nr:myeloid cell surface antigen CD33-like isoform X4 [Dipodomys spectabilis]
MWWWLLPPLLWALEQAQAEEPGKLSQADDGGVPDGSFWAAYNRYTLEMPESVTVQEGLCVLVPCTFFHSGLQSSTDPVFGYWFLDGTNILYGSPVATNNPHRDVDMETRGRFQLVGDPQDNNCSLGIRDAKRKDMGRYFFRIQSRSVRHSYKDNQLSLSVTELTEVPVVDVPETLQSGRHSNLTCLVPWACEQGTPPVFSWSSSSPTVLEPGANPTPVLPITPSPEHHGANLTCQATFPGVGVTVERTVRLNVSYAPQNLSISVSRGAGTGSQVLANGSSLEVEEGESLCFTCIVTASHPPATLLWARDDLVLGPSQPSGNETLRLVWARAEDSGEYVCRAQNPLGTQDTSVVLLVKRMWRGMVQGAITGAGVTALFAAGLCLIFFVVKTCRRKSVKKTRLQDSAHPAVSSFFLVQMSCCSHRPVIHPPSVPHFFSKSQCFPKPVILPSSKALQGMASPSQVLAFLTRPLLCTHFLQKVLSERKEFSKQLLVCSFSDWPDSTIQ